jgi:osmoprotectant transport system ATP-binding protein
VAPVLEAQSLSHRFGDVRALDAVTLSVADGELVAVVGESGSGKTTLLRCFNRLVTPAEGRVCVFGVPVQDQGEVPLRRRIGYVAQHGGLLPHWTVQRNVALVARLVGDRHADRAAGDALALVGLPAKAFGHRFPHELSGGQRQRAALARALAARQEVVLLDEPFGALDAISRSDVHEAFERVRTERAFTAMLITHDLAEAARLGDRVAVMRAGRIEQEGRVDELRRTPATEYVEALFSRAAAASRALAP